MFFDDDFFDFEDLFDDYDYQDLNRGGSLDQEMSEEEKERRRLEQEIEPPDPHDEDEDEDLIP